MATHPNSWLAINSGNRVVTVLSHFLQFLSTPAAEAVYLNWCNSGSYFMSVNKLVVQGANNTPGDVR
jgi:hypothetical protein